MWKQWNKKGVIGVAALAAMLVTMAFAATASAKLTGLFTRFQFCPYTNPAVERCLHSVTTGGKVVLGSKTVPIVNPSTLQGGLSEPAEEGPEAGFSKFFPATNGVTLSKASQPVPGGLAGFVNCKEIGNFLLRISCEGIFENGLTGVNSTLELAKSASDIRVSNEHFGEQIGVALKMPVRTKLENPLFGDSCFVGSASNPINWELRTGKTSPPPPNTSITGSLGKFSFLEEGQILEVVGAELVDNAWSAPSASGCGGIFSFIINPIVNSSSGLPSAAGKNTAILKNTLTQATSFAVKNNDEKNP
jgi:hypothetical protein